MNGPILPSLRLGFQVFNLGLNFLGVTNIHTQGLGLFWTIGSPLDRMYLVVNRPPDLPCPGCRFFHFLNGAIVIAKHVRLTHARCERLSFHAHQSVFDMFARLALGRHRHASPLYVRIARGNAGNSLGVGILDLFTLVGRPQLLGAMPANGPTGLALGPAQQTFLLCILFCDMRIVGKMPGVVRYAPVAVSNV